MKLNILKLLNNNNNKNILLKNILLKININNNNINLNNNNIKYINNKLQSINNINNWSYKLVSPLILIIIVSVFQSTKETLGGVK